MATHEELRKKIEHMERRYDSKFEVVFTAIKQILEPPAKPKPRIGFHAPQAGQRLNNKATRLVN